MTTPKPEAATPEQVTDVRELIERYRRWLSHTGYDGGVNSPPVLVLDALTAALEREEALRAALEPFAKAADIRLCAGPEYWTDEKPIQGTDIAFHVTFGDLRRARTALENTNGK